MKACFQDGIKKKSLKFGIWTCNNETKVRIVRLKFYLFFYKIARCKLIILSKKVRTQNCERKGSQYLYLILWWKWASICHTTSDLSVNTQISVLSSIEQTHLKKTLKWERGLNREQMDTLLRCLSWENPPDVSNCAHIFANKCESSVKYLNMNSIFEEK